MRRIARWMLNAAAAFSLLLCAAAVVFWVRGYYYLDTWEHLNRHTGHLLSAVSIFGGVQLGNVNNIYNRNGEWGWDWGPGGFQSIAVDSPRLVQGPIPRDFQQFSGVIPLHRFKRFGFLFMSGQLTKDVPYWTARIPAWCLALLFSVLPAARFWAIAKKAHWRRHGKCLKCGYDLRATPDRCPECGTPVSTKTNPRA